jgi:hypothetical protein
MSATSPPSPDQERWTTDYVSNNGSASKARSESVRRLVVLGYITAVAMPVIGLILGIVVATRPIKAYSRHGVWIIVVSVIASIVWILVLASGVFAVTNNDLSY